MKKHYLLLIIIILLGAFLRLYRLGEIPSGYFRDEAAISYNAYSIWESGKDEFGVRLPLVFRSFEVFFLPLYIYLSAPIVGLMGLSEFSSRLLSAISGIVALLFIYLIGKRIVNKKTGLLALLILAISPWHIYYSRGTFEGNLALTLFSGGFYFWLRFVEHFKKKYVLISGLLFAFSMYSYQAERLVVPLFSLIAIYLSFNKMWERRKALVVPALLIIAVLVPLLSLTFSAGGYHRASGVSILSSTSKPPGWIEGEPAGLFSNNKIYLRGRQLTALYLSYFSPKNIFIEADFDMQRSVEDFSVFYVWTLPFMLLGFYKLFSNFSKENKLLAVWIFLAPLPAAATADPFHTYRSLLLYFPLSLLAGKGLEVTYEYISAKKIAKLKHFGKYLFLLLLTFISIISLSAFLFSYVFVNPSLRARYWDYGYKELINIIGTLPKETGIVIDDPLTEAYIHYLFFNKTSPEVYHAEVAKLGDMEVYYYSDPSEIRPERIGNIEFRKVSWPTERGDRGKVFVMWHERLPESEFISDPNVELLKEVYYPDGKIGYRIVRVR